MIGNLKELYFIMHCLGSSTVLIDESAIFFKQILYY